MIVHHRSLLLLLRSNRRLRHLLSMWSSLLRSLDVLCRPMLGMRLVLVPTWHRMPPCASVPWNLSNRGIGRDQWQRSLLLSLLLGLSFLSSLVSLATLLHRRHLCQRLRKPDTAISVVPAGTATSVKLIDGGRMRLTKRSTFSGTTKERGVLKEVTTSTCR